MYVWIKYFFFLYNDIKYDVLTQQLKKTKSSCQLAERLSVVHLVRLSRS